MNKLKLFGKRVKELRKIRHLTQEQLAEIVGVDPKQICRIENGVCFTTYDTLYSIAKAIDVEISDLFKFDHKRPKEALISEMNEMFIDANEDKIETIYKLVKSIIH